MMTVSLLFVEYMPAFLHASRREFHKLCDYSCVSAVYLAIPPFSLILIVSDWVLN
jgi:hypothetical protein